jgi:heterotetrameric sarcosine oxidase gamma subunit
MAVLREVALEAQLSVRGEPQPGFPTEPNTASSDVLWLGPDEWLVLGGREEDYPDAAAAVDVSANRVCFELTGDDVEDVLAQGCTLDLHPSVFEVGRCAQTLLAKAQVILQRTGDETFRVFVRPSYAPYLRLWIDDAITSPRSSLRRR